MLISAPAASQTLLGRLVQKVGCTRVAAIPRPPCTRLNEMGCQYLGSAVGSSARRVGGAAVQQMAPTEPPANISSESSTPVHLVAVVAAEGHSPLGPPWLEVMQHMARKLHWTDEAFSMDVFTDADIGEGQQQQQQQQQQLLSAIGQAQIAIAVGITDPTAAAQLKDQVAKVPVFVCFDSAPLLEQSMRLASFQPEAPSLYQSMAAQLPWTQAAKDRALYTTVREFWGRHKSDDLLFLLLVLIDAYVAEVESVKALRAQDLGSIQCMATNCSPQILACLKSEQCRTALGCLQDCAPNDQVCSYQCIVSYESPEFEQFALCILQKHNCLGLNAQPPRLPDVQPMTHFRGEPLTASTAEDIFVGWLGHEGSEHSWRVVAGQNAAYDQFPCQFQVFYRGKAKGTMWYDPVFKVKTLTGGEVWRRRHYRVRRGQAAGTFHFSVLDNGVTSNEYWRIVDCTDDLSWALFYYSGAASVVGQSYAGAVFVTRTGAWPSEEHSERITMALEAAGIKEWELFRVDNSCCGGAPLGLPASATIPNQVGLAAKC